MNKTKTHKKIDKLSSSTFLMIFILLSIKALFGLDTYSLVSWASILLMPIFVFCSLLERGDVPKNEIKLSAVFIGIIALHIFFSKEESIPTMLITIALFFLYLRLPYVRVNYNIFWISLFGFLLIQIIFFFPDFLVALSHPTRDTAFNGFFASANGPAFLALCCIPVYFKIKKKTIKYFIAIIILLYVYACNSRGVMLSLIAFLINCYILKKGCKWYWPFIIISMVMIVSMVYMLVIEPTLVYSDGTLMGKTRDSAGRSDQILLVTEQFSVTWFGLGSDVVNNFVMAETTYGIHNMWLNTLYSMGVIYTLFYIVYIKYIYNKINSLPMKSLFLAYQLCFFFEPGRAFELLYSHFIAMSSILLFLSEELSKDRIIK